MCGIGGHIVHSGQYRAPGRRHVIHQTARSEERTILTVQPLVQVVHIEIGNHANFRRDGLPAKHAAHEIAAAWDPQPPALHAESRSPAAAQTQGGLSARVPTPSTGVVDLVKIALQVQPARPWPQSQKAAKLVARLLGEDREDRVARQEEIRGRAPVVPGHVHIATRPPVDCPISLGQPRLGKAPPCQPTERERIQQPVAGVDPCIPAGHMSARPEDFQDRHAHL